GRAPSRRPTTVSCQSSRHVHDRSSPPRRLNVRTIIRTFEDEVKRSVHLSVRGRDACLGDHVGGGAPMPPETRISRPSHLQGLALSGPRPHVASTWRVSSHTLDGEATM